MQAQGNLVGALKEYQAYMDICRRLTERDPDNSDWLSNLSVSHYLIASVLTEQGKLAEALIEKEANIKIAEYLAQLDLRNQQWQDDFKASRLALERLNQRLLDEGS